jgi:hypothetical protein
VPDALFIAEEAGLGERIAAHGSRRDPFPTERYFCIRAGETVRTSPMMSKP